MNSTASQQDDLNRGELLDKLKALITQTPNPPKENDHEQGLVMCINGGFGTGKTWTLLELKKQLETDGNPVAYLSAWESDHAGDAMVAIVSQLDKLILQKTKNWLEKEQTTALEKLKASSGWIQKVEHWLKEKKQTTALEKLKASSGRITRTVLKSLPDLLKGIPVLEGLSTTINHYLEASDSTKKHKQYDAVEQFEQRTQALSKSKKALAKLASDEFFASNGKRLVILIDELDRCRPTYAIEMLEAIKHWFCVPNVVFVLAMDREQLSHSIRAVYGQGFDVDGYFLRFFHRPIFLRRPEKHLSFISESLRFYISEVDKKLASNCAHYAAYTYSLNQSLREYSFSQLFSSGSLREHERVLYLFEMALINFLSKQDAINVYPPFIEFLFCLVMVKVYHPLAYSHFIHSGFWASEEKINSRVLGRLIKTDELLIQTRVSLFLLNGFLTSLRKLLQTNQANNINTDQIDMLLSLPEEANYTWTDLRFSAAQICKDDLINIPLAVNLLELA